MKYLRRFLWYIAKRLLGVTILAGVLIIAFYLAMNTANITILLKDGMAMRAEVVMKQEDPTDLTKYFDENFLQVDAALKAGISDTSPYKDYNITGIDHRLSLEWMWCWPWDTTARAEFTETIPRIDGRVKSSSAEAARALYGDGFEYPPKWQGGRYSATLVKENGQWHVRSLTLISQVEE